MHRVGPASGEHIVVRLLGSPVDLFFAAQEGVDGLVREFTLIAFGRQSGVTEHEVPVKLRELVEEVGTRFGGFAADIAGVFERAAAAGETSVDLEIAMHPIGVDISARFAELLDQADEFCRSGDLLTLAAPPEVVAWRRWWFGEVVGQGREGRAPVGYPEAMGHKP